MNWKKFFNPTIANIILFLILITISTLFSKNLTYGYGGWPLHFWPIKSFGVAGFIAFEVAPPFLFLNFMADILFWYLISCGIAAFKASRERIILFMVLLIVGVGFITGPYYFYAPPTPGHEATLGMFGVAFGDTSFDVAKLIFYISLLVTTTSLIFLTGFIINKLRK